MTGLIIRIQLSTAAVVGLSCEWNMMPYLRRCFSCHRRICYCEVSIYCVAIFLTVVFVDYLAGSPMQVIFWRRRYILHCRNLLSSRQSEFLSLPIFNHAPH